MSRAPVIVSPPPGVMLSRLPTLRGKRAAHEWINNVLGVPMTANYIKVSADKRRLKCTKCAGALYFCTQDLFDFVMSHVEAAS